MSTTNTNIKKVKAGLYGIGLETYWAQFDGMLDRLQGYQQQIREKMTSANTEVTDAGLVFTVEGAHQAAELFRKNQVDVIFLYISTYSLSSIVLPVVQKVNVPVVVLNLQPAKAIDYNYINNLGDRGKMTGEWLANCQACAVPEVASVFNKAGIKYDIVTGFLEDETAWTEIRDWTDAVYTAAVMRNNRVGLLGHYYCGMLDVYTDLTAQSAAFGSHFEMVEMCELHKYREETSDKELEQKLAQFRSVFNVAPECEQEELIRAAKTSIALDKLVNAHNLGSLAYYYEGTAGNPYENIITSVIAGNTLLTSYGVPVAGEYEVKNVQAMKIMDALDAGGSFSEFYGMDFNDDIILLGHDGPGHAVIAEEKIRLVPLPLYHGKPGKGLSIQMRVKNGPVTILSVCQDKGEKIKLLVAEGESVPGPILEIGNTNSRYKFSVSPKTFMETWSKAGPSHHCAIGTGHVAGKIEKLGRVLNLEVVRV